MGSELFPHVHWFARRGVVVWVVICSAKALNCAERAFSIAEMNGGGYVFHMYAIPMGR